MFTGIISDIGTIVTVSGDSDRQFTIRTGFDLTETALGASIACSGVCLTVTGKTADCFTVDVSGESLSRSTLGHWQPGTKINLERALRAGEELGGHIVSGHVDGLAIVETVTETGNSHKLTLRAPRNLLRYIAEKGSVTLDGVSLTVNDAHDHGFWVTLIPHTWQHTTLSLLKAGDPVNLEIDMLARYIERMQQMKG